MAKVRFRPHQSILVAAFIGFVSILPIAFGPDLPSATAGSAGSAGSAVRWLFVPLLIIPILIFMWALRTGTDADADGLRVRALFGNRRIPWSAVRELAGDARGRAVALLDDGHAVTLSQVKAADIGKLVDASGQGISRTKPQ